MCEQLIAAQRTVTGTINPREQALPEYFAPLAASELVSVEACDLADPAAFRNVLRSLRPEHVYHLGALSSPALCAEQPDLSRAVNVTSLEVLLDWVKRDSPQTRVLAASSAAIFGNPAESPQNEDTPASPQNEYGRQKLQIREIAAQARSEGLFVATAIPFNHESERRPEEFVIAKIAWGAARISRGLKQKLKLGDVSPRRDWGYAPEYAKAYIWMLDVEEPLELVLATGEIHSVKEAVELAFDTAGVHYDRYESNATLRLPGDPQDSVGDSSRAWEELGWEAEIKFTKLIPRLVEHAISVLAAD